MKRITLYVSTLLSLVAIWLGLRIQFRAHPDENLRLLIDFAPVIAVIIFGCLCVAKLAWDLMTFNDYPQEIKVLENVSEKSDILRSMNFLGILRIIF